MEEALFAKAGQDRGLLESTLRLRGYVLYNASCLHLQHQFLLFRCSRATLCFILYTVKTSRKKEKKSGNEPQLLPFVSIQSSTLRLRVLVLLS